jgi:hypothetical protein
MAAGRTDQLLAVGRDQVDLVDVVPRVQVTRWGATPSHEWNDNHLAFTAGRLALHAIQRSGDLKDHVGARMLRERLEHLHAKACRFQRDGRFRNGPYLVR